MPGHSKINEFVRFYSDTKSRTVNFVLRFSFIVFHFVLYFFLSVSCQATLVSLLAFFCLHFQTTNRYNFKTKIQFLVYTIFPDTFRIKYIRIIIIIQMSTYQLSKPHQCLKTHLPHCYPSHFQPRHLHICLELPPLCLQTYLNV